MKKRFLTKAITTCSIEANYFIYFRFAIMEKFSVLESAEKLKIKHGRLREWISRRYIIPYKPTTGRGTKNHLNKLNLYQIKLFEHLLHRGLSRDAVVEMMPFITSATAIRNPEDLQKKYPDNIEVDDFEFHDFLIFYKLKDSLQVFGNSEKGSVSINTNIDFEDAVVINYKKIRNEVDSLL